MLRQMRGFEPCLPDQLAHRSLAHGQQLEHPHPRRMGQRLEQLSLDLMDRRRHLRWHPATILDGFIIPCQAALVKTVTAPTDQATPRGADNTGEAVVIWVSCPVLLLDDATALGTRTRSRPITVGPSSAARPTPAAPLLPTASRLRGLLEVTTGVAADRAARPGAQPRRRMASASRGARRSLCGGRWESSRAVIQRRAAISRCGSRSVHHPALTALILR